MPRGLSGDTENETSPDYLLSDQDKGLFDTDSPDSGHREMSVESLGAHFSAPDFPFLTMSADERMKYSIGFGSPVKFQKMSYEMTAIVNSNPFANSRDDISERETICHDTDGKDVGKIPKLRPPPEFRSYGAYRNSQISEDDSSNSSNSDTDSVKDGIVNFTDSDYFSHTGNSSLTNTINSNANNNDNNNIYTDSNCNQALVPYDDHRELVPYENNRSIHVHQHGTMRPKLEYYYNNLESDRLLMQKYLDQSKRARGGSFSDEDNTESYDDALVHRPSPPPPPSRVVDEDYDDWIVYRYSETAIVIAVSSYW